MATKPEKILTIGVHGFAEAEFFAKLAQAKVDLLVDIRRRRGLRGSQYAFANSARLQEGLTRHGIGYVHAPELAPTEEILIREHARDARDGIAKRQREELHPEFIAEFEACCLSHFAADAFLHARAPGAAQLCFLCVERNPEACHRSLVAQRLEREWKIPLQHLLPKA